MISTTAETATNETTTNETTANETTNNETPNPVKTTKSSYLFYFTRIGGLLACAYYFLPKQTMLLAHELNVETIKKSKIELKSFGTLVEME